MVGRVGFFFFIQVTKSFFFNIVFFVNNNYSVEVNAQTMKLFTDRHQIQHETLYTDIIFLGGM